MFIPAFTVIDVAVLVGTFLCLMLAVLTEIGARPVAADYGRRPALWWARRKNPSTRQPGSGRLSAVAVVTVPFVLTCFAVVLTPGPSLAVIIDQCLRTGRPAGVATVAGNTSGLVVWAGASALGLTVLVQTSQIAFLALKIVGAAYLCWLGVQALRRSRRHVGSTAEPAIERPKGLVAAYRAGLLANLSNPKAAALYLALLPQFLPTGQQALIGTATLAGVQMAISACWYLLVVLAVGTVRRILARPKVRARLDQLTGLALIGLSVRLATLSRAAA